MIYMTRIQNMSFFLLQVNNPSVWPCRAPRLATPSGHPSGTLSGPHWAPRLATRREPRPAPSGPQSSHPVWPPRLHGCQADVFGGTDDGHEGIRDLDALKHPF
jgi:hypothetical protein